MTFTITSSSKGFVRKAKAPASSAVWRTDGSSRPVMKIIRVSGESRRRLACTSKPFITGIHTSRTATRHRACSSLARKATGSLNFSTMRPAEVINRPSALSMETSSSRSQIPSRAEALSGELFVSKTSKRLKEFALGMSIHSCLLRITMGLRSMARYETLVSSHTRTGGRILSRFLYVSRGASGCLKRLALPVIFLRFCLPPQPKLGGLGVVLLRLRQTNCETCASTVTIFSREGSAMRLDDAARNGQPHSGSFGFCRKEWLEKFLGHSAGKARASIAHADENVSIPITARPDEKASRIGGDSRHRFKGVEREIEKHLQELHRISPNLARIGTNFGCHFHVPSNGISVHNAEQLVNRVLDRD